jgi:hypothetical protein
LNCEITACSVEKCLKDTDFDVLVLRQPAVDLDQEAIKMLGIAEIWGGLPAFLKEFHLISFSQTLLFTLY